MKDLNRALWQPEERGGLILAEVGATGGSKARGTAWPTLLSQKGREERPRDCRKDCGNKGESSFCLLGAQMQDY